MAFTLEDNANSGESSANPKTLTGLFTGTNTTVLVVYVVSVRNARSGGNPTFGTGPSTVTLISAGSSQSSGGEGFIECFYALNSDLPDTVGIVISVPNPNTRDLSILGSVYTSPSKKIASFIDTSQGAGSTGNPIAPSVTVGVPALVVNGVFTGAASVNHMFADQTLLGKFDSGDEGHAHQYFLQSSALASKIMSWTWTPASSEDWATNSVSFQESDPTNVSSHDTVTFVNIGSIDSTAIASIKSIDTVLTGN